TITLVAAGTFTYTLTCTSASGDTANATVTVRVSVPTVSVTNTFSPNAVTIPTSEGAPYGEADILQRGRGIQIDQAFGYGPTKVLRTYICLNGMISYPQCSQLPPQSGPLPSALLAAIDAGIASFAGSGVRLLIRFIYNFGPIGARDVPATLIATHIDQL